MSGDAEVRLDDDASGAIERNAEGLRERGRLDAGGPEDRSRRDGRIADTDFVIADARDDGVGEDFDAEVAELIGGFGGERRRIGRKNAFLSFHENYARARRIDSPKVAEHGLARDLRQ